MGYYRTLCREDSTVKDIKAYLDRFVIGQEEAKRQIALLGFLHKVRWNYYRGDNKSGPMAALTGHDIPPLHGLLTGPTGCGKTYIVNLMAEFLSFPVIKLDASALVPEGYKGVSFTEALLERLSDMRSLYNQKQLSHAIVILDEFDKLCAGSETAFYRQIQYSLLKAVEGSKVSASNDRNQVVDIDTSNMLFVVSGSFAHLEAILDASRKDIGFGAALPQVAGQRTITSKDLETAGLVRELAGRVGVISQVLPLTIEELRQAITSPEGFLHREFAYLFTTCDKEIYSVVTDEMIDRAVTKCHDSKLGARGLRTALFAELLPELEKLSLGTYVEKLIDDGVVEEFPGLSASGDYDPINGDIIFK